MSGSVDALAVETEDFDRVARDLDHVVFFEVHHPVGDLDQRLRIRPEEVLANADADQ